MSEAQVKQNWHDLLITNIFRPVSFMVQGSMVAEDLAEVSLGNFY